MVKGHFSDQLIWRQPLFGEVSRAPTELRDWLLDSGSLTQSVTTG